MEKLSLSVVESFKSGIQLLTGYERRKYAAELAQKYFNSSPRKTERALGVSRDLVKKGLGEQRTGIRCVDNFSQRGKKKIEVLLPNLSADVEQIVSLNTQSDRCHNDTTGYVKTTAKQVQQELVAQGYNASDFCIRTVNNVLNRLDYSLKKVRKTLALKRIAATDAIFENIAANRKATSVGILKLSIDVKDKVRVGQLSRKGYHRGKEHLCALDKDQHWEQTLVPFGITEIVSAKTTIVVGDSNETSDFIVDGLEKWYEIEKENLKANGIHTLEIYSDNGPSVNSNRTQFIKRIIEFACITGLKIHLVYYPPYHSKYNPVERVWAAVEQYWNGTLLSSVGKVINTLQNVKWKGKPLNAFLMSKPYLKGISLSTKEMLELEPYLIRKDGLEKWDVWIKPSPKMGRLFFA